MYITEYSAGHVVSTQRVGCRTLPVPISFSSRGLSFFMYTIKTKNNALGLVIWSIIHSEIIH